MAGYEISMLKGTPLYALAKNANIYGGKTLSKTEMVFFQQQCREMGFDPEKYGLEIVQEDVEGADFKETRKNQERLNKSISDAYKSQFDQKNAYDIAQQAETKAYAVIYTAKDAFTNAHGEQLQFIPEDLGRKPNPMDPKYAKNLNAYVADLTAWAKDVANGYTDASHMTSVELANIIMQNDNENAAINVEVTMGAAEAVMENDDLNTALLMQQIEDGTAQIIKQVKIEGGATRVAIKNAKGEIINAVRTAEGNILSEVQWQNWYNRFITIDQGNKTRKTVENTAQQTQVLNGYSDKINERLNRVISINDSHTRISNMRNKILNSNLPYEQRRELMAHLASFCTQDYFSEADLASEETKINEAINAQ